MRVLSFSKKQITEAKPRSAHENPLGWMMKRTTKADQSAHDDCKRNGSLHLVLQELAEDIVEQGNTRVEDRDPVPDV
jgi:hypothetical protein